MNSFFAVHAKGAQQASLDLVVFNVMHKISASYRAPCPPTTSHEERRKPLLERRNLWPNAEREA
jgi:hypothetical protein